jgi:hypothetical protein
LLALGQPRSAVDMIISFVLRLSGAFMRGPELIPSLTTIHILDLVRQFLFALNLGGIAARLEEMLLAGSDV